MITFNNSDNSNNSFAENGQKPEEDFTSLLDLFVPIAQNSGFHLETGTFPEADFPQVSPNKPQENSIQPALLTTAGFTQNLDWQPASKPTVQPVLKLPNELEIPEKISTDEKQPKEILSFQLIPENPLADTAENVLSIPLSEVLTTNTQTPEVVFSELKPSLKTKDVVSQSNQLTPESIQLTPDSSLKSVGDLAVNLETEKKEFVQVTNNSLFASQKEIELIEQQLPHETNQLFASQKEIESIEILQNQEVKKLSANIKKPNVQQFHQVGMFLEKENHLSLNEKNGKKFPPLFQEVTANNVESPQVFNLTENLTSEASASNSLPKSVDLAEQIKPQLFEFVKSFEILGERKTLEIRLRPAELGKLEIRLEKDDNGKLHLHFQTENEMTSQILSESFENLRDSLQNSGWQIEKIEISINSFASGGNNQQDTSRQPEIVDTQQFFDVESEENQETDSPPENRLVSLRA